MSENSIANADNTQESCDQVDGEVEAAITSETAAETNNAAIDDASRSPGDSDGESQPTEDAAAETETEVDSEAETNDSQATSDTNDDEPIELTPEDLATVEAVIFTTDTPISPGKIAEVAQIPGGRKAVQAAIDALNDRYDEIGSAFRIESRAAGYRMFTRAEHNEVLAKLLKVRSENKLSQSAMETLSIIAYKQPVLRADIEAIRGVSSGEMVRSLMEKSLVKIVGRAEEIGRPMLYGTTAKFLEVFGLNSVKDLPEVDSGVLSSPKAIRPNADVQSPVGQDATESKNTAAEDKSADKDKQDAEANADARTEMQEGKSPAAGDVTPAETPDETATEQSSQPATPAPEDSIIASDAGENSDSENTDESINTPS